MGGRCPESGSPRCSSCSLRRPSPSCRGRSSGGGTAREGALFLLLPVGAQGVGHGKGDVRPPTPGRGLLESCGAGLDGWGGGPSLQGAEHVAGEATRRLGPVPAGRGWVPPGYRTSSWDVGDQDLRTSRGSAGLHQRPEPPGCCIPSPAPMFSRLARRGQLPRWSSSGWGGRGECREQTVTGPPPNARGLLGVQAIPLKEVPLRLGANVGATWVPGCRWTMQGRADPLPTRVADFGGLMRSWRALAEGGVVRSLGLTAEGRTVLATPAARSV